MVPLHSYLLVSAALFSVGVLGVLLRRNAIVIFMSIEIMLNAANLSFATFARFLDGINGQIYVFFVMVVAAAEVTVGLAIIVTVYRNWRNISVDVLKDLHG